jgi:hypothetical protein
MGRWADRRAAKQARELGLQLVAQQQREAVVAQCIMLVVQGQEVRFPAALWETRAVRRTMYASQRYANTRFGGAQSESTETLRCLDDGTFTVGPERAVFVGSKMQRMWEYRNVLGTQWDGQVLSIAVSNRQKVAGVSFHSDSPVIETFQLALAQAQD